MAQLRELSGGKPVGFKLCLGSRREFMAICKAMLKTGITPDFITVDGGEGGTGAAPLEFSNSVGTPGIDGLVFVHNALVGANLRDRIRIFPPARSRRASTSSSASPSARTRCNSARGMMFALGCIQALRCNTNQCPTGVATQDPELVAGLFVPEKRRRVANFHHQTIHSACQMIEAMGLDKPSALRPWHIYKRVGPYEIKNYSEIFEYVGAGALLGAEIPASFERAYSGASAESFGYAGSDSSAA